MTARKASRSCCRAPSRTCWPTARPASRSAWRPRIPPHNAGEVCAAAIHLIQHPDATTADLLRAHARPGFPHRRRAGRGRGVDPGRLRDRPRRLPRCARKWEVEKGKHGTWQIVVTEIPYQVQKSQADRADRPAAGGEETAAARRRARRKHRGRPPGAGAEDPRRRAGSADGDGVPRHRAGNPLPAQHERAGRRRARRG